MNSPLLALILGLACLAFVVWFANHNAKQPTRRTHTDEDAAIARAHTILGDKQ